MVGTLIVSEGEVVRPSQLIARVRQTRGTATRESGGRMESARRVVAIAIAGLGFASGASADTVQIYAGGTLRGAFQARGQPYATDGPSVSVYLENRDVKTTDGQVVTGFQFIGWQEGQGVRIQVFLLVPAKGEANAYVPEGKTERLARRHFSSVLLAKGDEVVLGKMHELGVEPMKLRLR